MNEEERAQLTKSKFLYTKENTPKAMTPEQIKEEEKKETPIERIMREQREKENNE